MRLANVVHLGFVTGIEISQVSAVRLCGSRTNFPKADEPEIRVGYEARLSPSWWPERILQRVLLAYAQRHGITAIRAVVSATGPYVGVLQRVRWRAAGIDDALLITPEAQPGGLRRSPATQGETLAALRDGTLAPDWQSSYGLGLNIRSC